MSLIISLIGFGALAMMVHELGHLLAARSCSVPASEMGFGMGPRLAGFRLGGIRFNLRAIPLASFVMLDGAVLKEKSVHAQLLVHLGGILFNIVAGWLTYGSIFGWLNLLLAAGNILPLYQHDGWKCGVPARFTATQESIRRTRIHLLGRVRQSHHRVGRSASVYGYLKRLSPSHKRRKAVESALRLLFLVLFVAYLVLK
jgi:membrane-associated protease RseP (regulator of RpoE activity)